MEDEAALVEELVEQGAVLLGAQRGVAPDEAGAPRRPRAGDMTIRDFPNGKRIAFVHAGLDYQDIECDGRYVEVARWPELYEAMGSPETIVDADFGVELFKVPDMTVTVEE